ncbi:MAG: polysaccharide pyruvyl transferase family protein [Candidatus Nezhaarchaeota archaeon]|nr:polysaccharide pyruvyl transferase family protein [Candidatus Nezhaarchaeota archaeon]
MKALLHGYFGYGNVGDEAILSVLIDELKSMGFEPIALSIFPDRTSRLHGIKACNEKITSPGFWKNFLKSHVLVFAGGGRYGKATMRRICILAILAKALAKSVEFRALGVYPYEWKGLPTLMDLPGPFDDFLTRTLIKIAFRFASKVSVRDEFSKQVLYFSGVRKRIDVEEDLAFKLSPSNCRTSLSILAKHHVDPQHEPLIGVNLRTLHQSVRSNIVDVVGCFLNWLIESYDVKVVFIPFGYGSVHGRFFDDDLIIAEELKRTIKQHSKFKVLREERKPQDILGLFRFFNLFVGMRFHSIIFSIMMGIPTIAIIYDTKTAELMKRGWMSRHHCVHFSISKLSMGALKDAARLLLDAQPRRGR